MYGRLDSRSAVNNPFGIGIADCIIVSLHLAYMVHGHYGLDRAPKSSLINPCNWQGMVLSVAVIIFIKKNGIWHVKCSAIVITKSLYLVTGPTLGISGKIDQLNKNGICMYVYHSHIKWFNSGA